MDSTTVTLGDFVFHEIENAKEEGVTCAHLSSLFKAAEIEIRRCLLDLLGMGLVVQHDNNWKLKRQYEEDEAVSAVQRDIGQLSLGGREVVPRRQSVERPRRVSSTPDGTLTAGQRGNPPSMTSRSSCPAELASRTRPTSRSSSTILQSSPSQPRSSTLAAGQLANPSNTAAVYTPGEVNLSSVSSKSRPVCDRRSASAPSLPQFQESRIHMAVATRPSTEMICSNPDVQINKNAIGKIAQVLSVANDAMLAKDIAQKSGLGQSRADVNGWLYFMKKQNKVEQVDKIRWRRKGNISPSDIDFMSNELAKINPSKKMKELAEKSPSQKMKDGKACHSILSAERLHTMPNQRDLGKISQRIGREFEQLGLELGLIKAEIDQIRINNPLHIKDVIFNMLLTWEEKFGMNATFGCLENAMIAVGIDTIEVFKDIDHW